MGRDGDGKRPLQAQGIANALCRVAQDMLQMKYGRTLDGSDFVTKVEKHCGSKFTAAETATPAGLDIATRLNKLPDLRFKDEVNRELFQLEFDVRTLTDFAQLHSEVIRTPGTARAVAVIRPDVDSASVPHAVAVFRAGYAIQDLLVGQASRPSHDKTAPRSPPLQHFDENRFLGAVVVDPKILKVVRFDSTSRSMEEQSLPEPLDEYSVLLDTWDSGVEKARHALSKNGVEEEKDVPLRTLLAKASSSHGGSKEALRAAAAALIHPDLRTEDAVGLMARLGVLRSQNPDGLEGGSGASTAPSIPSMLVQALRRFGGDALLVQQACQVVCEASRNSGASAKALVKAHAPAAICDVMEIHLRNPAVQSSTISALRCLAQNEGQIAMDAPKAADGVRRALEKHPRDKALHRGGQEALRLMGQSPVPEGQGPANTGQINGDASCSTASTGTGGHAAWPRAALSWLVSIFSWGSSTARDVLTSAHQKEQQPRIASGSAIDKFHSGIVPTASPSNGRKSTPRLSPPAPATAQRVHRQASRDSDDLEIGWADSGNSKACMRGPWALGAKSDVGTSDRGSETARSASSQDALATPAKERGHTDPSEMSTVASTRTTVPSSSPTTASPSPTKQEFRRQGSEEPRLCATQDLLRASSPATAAPPATEGSLAANLLRPPLRLQEKMVQSGFPSPPQAQLEHPANGPARELFPDGRSTASRSQHMHAL